ncbi:MAG: hypothetical protein WBG19_00365 [Thermoplasmata archaeon]
MGAIFGTPAPPLSDWVALFEIGIAGLLLVGMFVVRAGHVRLHKYIQSSMILVNIPVVLAWMVPQYLTYVLPDLGSEISQPYYYLPTIALVAGSLAELLGIYILLVAGTNLLPERYRFRRYKLWMRTELGLWWTVVVIGLLTYYFWYVSVAPSSGSGGW